MKTKTQQNIVLLSVKFIAKDLIGDILYWPIWWYSAGIQKVFIYISNELANFEERLGLKIWLKSIFKPMFAQYDWQGRIISFFMRLILLVFKLVLFFFWMVFMSVFVALWLILPILAVYQIASFGIEIFK